MQNSPKIPDKRSFTYGFLIFLKVSILFWISSAEPYLFFWKSRKLKTHSYDFLQPSVWVTLDIWLFFWIVLGHSCMPSLSQLWKCILLSKSLDMLLWGTETLRKSIRASWGKRQLGVRVSLALTYSCLGNGGSREDSHPLQSILTPEWKKKWPWALDPA